MLRVDGGGWTLRIDGEPDWTLDPADHDPGRRARLVARDGLDEAIVALSSPMGVEALPPEEARPLIAAYHAGVSELPAGLRAWAAASLAEPDPEGLREALDLGLVGLCLPAGALTRPEGLARCGPLLEVLEERAAPLLVHPGPAPWASPPPAGRDRPSWWPAMTTYVSQMQVAWLAFRTWGRAAHPRLRVCFAMLAGLGPLQVERLAGRGGDDDAHDPLAFYDTSSYGPRAVAAMAAIVGRHALVHGSDRPVVAPRGDGPAPLDPIRAANPARLLAPSEAPA